MRSRFAAHKLSEVLCFRFDSREHVLQVFPELRLRHIFKQFLFRQWSAPTRASPNEATNPPVKPTAELEFLTSVRPVTLPEFTR